MWGFAWQTQIFLEEYSGQNWPEVVENDPKIGFWNFFVNLSLDLAEIDVKWKY